MCAIIEKQTYNECNEKINEIITNKFVINKYNNKYNA